MSELGSIEENDKIIIKELGDLETTNGLIKI